MRRYAVLSVFVFLLSLFVSCSLIEPSEKKASLAIGLNVSLPESSFLQANSASHLLQFDEEPHIEDEEFNSIEYTADVTITWDGGVSVGSGKIKRSNRQEELGDGNKASGTVAVINLPMNKTLFALIEIKDSDGDVLYSANKTLILAGEVTPITIDLAYSVDADGSVTIKNETTELMLKAEYGTQKDSDTSIETFNIEDGKELVFTCLNVDGTKITENVTYEWRINGTNLNDDSTEDYGDTDSIAFNPKQCALIDIGGKNTVECFVKYVYVNSSKTVSCSRMFAFNFTEADGAQYIYPKKTGSSEFYCYDTRTKTSSYFIDSNAYAFKNDGTFAVLHYEDGNSLIDEYSYQNGVYAESVTTSLLDLELRSGYRLTYATDGKLWIYGENTSGTKGFLIRSSSENKFIAQTIENSGIAIAGNYLVYISSSGSLCYRKITEDGDGNISIGDSDVGEILKSEFLENRTCNIAGIYPVLDTETNEYKLYVLLNFKKSESLGLIILTGGVAVAELTDTGFVFEKESDGETIKIYGMISLDDEDSYSEWSFSSISKRVVAVPTAENESYSFFNPLGFYAIKEDELYIPDAGIYQKKDSDYSCFKYKSRIMKFNLKTKTASVATENPSIVIEVPSSSSGDPLNGCTYEK